MNRIEQKMALLKQENKKAFITYMTAGLPDMEGTKDLIRVQEEAGVDVLELGIPFSDPIADGPVIQAASYQSICRGTNLKKVFRMMEEIRSEGTEIPVVFMMYYNTVLCYGIEAFVKKCKAVGVDGLIVPDLPLEEQGALQEALDQEDGAILIQLVSPVSKKRIPAILEHARGFVYCVSSMGVTGQAGTFHKEILNYLSEVKAASEIPVMMGFGIRMPGDIAPMKNIIDGAIVGSHFIQLLEQSGYSTKTAREYCSNFKQNIQQEGNYDTDSN